MSNRNERAHPRVAADISATIKLPNGRIVTSAQIRNLSLGGVFIEVADPPSFGTEFDLEFRLPAAPEAIRCRGLVMWNTRSQPNKDFPNPGMGVRLMKIGVQEMRMLSAYIDSKLKP